MCEREKDEGERKSVNLIRNLGHGIGLFLLIFSISTYVFK